MIKPKQSIFNYDNLHRAIQSLQPVTITDSDHGADWWSDNFGLRVTHTMVERINLVKLAAKGVEENKIEFMKRLNKLPLMVWPKNIEDEDFWNNEFGQTIFKNWSTRWKNFISSISLLV